MTDHAASSTLLLDTTVERTLTAWESEWAQAPWRNAHVEGWLFEGVAERRAAERRLAAAGVHARLRCAYKPLVHYFLEEVAAEQVAQAVVRCPAPIHGAARRFQVEAYPLAALLRPGALRWDDTRPGHGPWYDVTLTMDDGTVQSHRVFVPLRAHADAIGAPQVSPTGWLRVGRGPGGGELRDEAVTTDFEALFAHVIDTVRRHPWPQQEPYFERLDIRIDLHGFEQALPGMDEVMSSYEALHEDVYFSLLEMFQQHSGRATGDRRLQPGQTVPDIRPATGAPRVRIALRPFDTAAQDASAWTDATAGQPFEAMGMAPPPERVAATLAQWPGQRFGATSRQGRAVQGLYHPGSDVPVFISGGQHANETSGVVGALRAAQALLAQRPGAHFALLPLENPDGYALHRELGAQHPHHMHHAARYSALGDDIAYREGEGAPLYERAAREQALALSGAQLHINLHGYPAHEWTRPLSGYVPRGFEQWMLPKGFFLILRCHAGWQDRGRALLQAVTAALRSVPGLPEYNARQMALYAQHAGPIPFEVLHGTACLQSETSDGAPVTLITEFPDETIGGDAFRFAHTVQKATVLAAQQAWQEIAARPQQP
ncbi:peptidase M14 [Paracidovorax wautersii]|uniref:Zinc carboxypeptidase n=1 Tax=Paracidovorax wautersii TaxID=1177982 RepID=A0ABU1IHC2_9BURK|nr:peptidase M14 [Paracidovorax wautersii]MDR6215818.1 hypothetical protein [Paracidovorax wautersii]